MLRKTVSNRQSFRVPLANLIVLVILLMAGCDTTIVPELPLVEPTTADQPDPAAIALASQSTVPQNEQVAVWPALFGPDRCGVISSSINPVWSKEGPRLVWETEIGTGYGSPVTASGVVVFNHRVDNVETIQCHDVANGELRWKHSYPTSAVCDFEYSDGPYSTPIIDWKHNRVFNIGSEGQFMCLGLLDGDVQWSRSLHDEYGVSADIFPVGAGAVLDHESTRPGGQLIFNLGAYDREAGIISLDTETGETVWETTDHGPSYATPLVARIHGQRFAFVLTDVGLVCLDPDTGEVDWDFEYARRGDLARNATSPMVFGDHVLVVCSGIGAKSVQVMSDRTYQESWRQRRTLDSQYNPLIMDKDHVFSFTSAGQGGAELRCVRLIDGEIEWSYHSVLKRGMGFTTPNALVLLGERGHLASLIRSAEKPSVISFTDEPLMSEPCYCSPAVHGNYLVLKDEERVAVFDCTY